MPHEEFLIICPMREFMGNSQSLVYCWVPYTDDPPPFFFLKELQSAFLNCAKNPILVLEVFKTNKQKI